MQNEKNDTIGNNNNDMINNTNKQLHDRNELNNKIGNDKWHTGKTKAMINADKAPIDTKEMSNDDTH